jgi:hypothetical protein
MEELKEEVRKLELTLVVMVSIISSVIGTVGVQIFWKWWTNG